MAIVAIQGLMGAGKSYVAVNVWMRDELMRTERHIYTNLPLRRVDDKDKESDWEIVAQCATTIPGRRKMMERIHILRSAMQIPTNEDGTPVLYYPLDEEGERVKGSQAEVLGEKHMVREFWYFTRPNSIVMLDEVADIWPTEDRKNRPPEMKSYIRHHRHYKDDLYFMFQDKEDVDPDLRRKIQKLWVVENSTKTNMFEASWMKGLRWPLQFFMCKSYLGRVAVGKDENSLKQLQSQDSKWFYPWPSGFRCYRSFSKASTLAGKAAAADSDESSDMQKGVWPKIRDFVGNLAPLVSLAGGVVLAGFGFYWGYQTLMKTMVMSSPVAMDGAIPKRVKGELPVIPGASIVDLGVSGDFMASMTNGAKAVPADREALVFATRGWFKTNSGRYNIGDLYDGKKVTAVGMDGVAFDGGVSRSWASLFPR